MEKTLTEIYNVINALRVPSGSLEYIKQVFIGAATREKLQFPFIAIVGEREHIEALTAGSPHGADKKTFTIQIHFGQRYMVPQTAAIGDGITKGIYQIGDQLQQIFRGQYFNGSFSAPCNTPDINYLYEVQGNEMVWEAQLTIEGWRKEPRPQP